MIAYDDVDNDRGSATEGGAGGGGGGGGGGRSRQARNRRRAVSLPGQFLLVRRVVDFFRGFPDSRSPNVSRTGERRSSIRDTGRTHDSDPLSGSGLYRAITRLAIERIK